MKGPLPIPPEQLGSAIRSTRKRLGLNQPQFTRLIGVRQQIVSKWENGEALRSVVPVMRLAVLLLHSSTADLVVCDVVNHPLVTLGLMEPSRPKRYRRRKPSLLDAPFAIARQIGEYDVRELPISSRLARTLSRMEIHKLGDLQGRTPREFLKYIGSGVTTLQELRRVIAGAKSRISPVSESAQ